MLESQLVEDLAIVLVVASLVTYAFHRLKQPVVLGYIVAGVIIGPYTPPSSLISQPDIIGALAEVGVILLLFAVGLEFPLHKLRSIGKATIVTAAMEIALMIGVSQVIGFIFGWSLLESLFLGAALASSSTTIISKVLRDMGKLQETSSAIMLGVLVAEDLVVVALLASLQSVATAGSVSTEALLVLAAKVAVFLVVSILTGIKLVSPLIDRIASEGISELTLITTVGICFAFSVVAYLLGFSVAIGAFISGMVIAGVRQVGEVSQLIGPLRDLFGAIFFVSAGALMNIAATQFLLPAAIVTITMVVGKIVGCSLGTRLSGYDSQTAIKVGLGMAQIGEFAFIVMKTGSDVGVVPASLYAAVGISAIATTFLTPYFIRFASRRSNPVVNNPHISLT